MYPAPVVIASRAARAPSSLLLSLVFAVGAAACGGDVGQAPVSPATGATTVSSGASAPWPATAVVKSPGLRTSTRPLPHDIAQLRGVRDVAISPDGSRIAYVVRAPRFDTAAKPAPDDTKGGWKIDQQLFLVDRRGGEPLQLTFGEQSVQSARFSPDGRDLAFVREKGGKPSLSILHLGGGEARAVDVGEYLPQAFDWMPDGSLAFLAERPRSAADKEARWRRGGAVAWDREWEQIHLFVVGRGGGKVRHVNRGTDTVVGFRVSPDGATIALVTAPSSDPLIVFTRQRLALVRAADGQLVRELEPARHPIAALEWSPDGRYLAYATTASGFSHIDELKVVRADSSARPVNLAAGLDLTMVGIAWSGSRAVVAAALARTRTALYRMPVDGGKARELPRAEHIVSSLSGDRRGRFAVSVGATSRAPADPVVIDLASGVTRAVAALNPETAKWSLAPTEVVKWKNREGTALEGTLVRTSTGGGKAPPLLVMPHGGPDGVTSIAWGTWSQYFAARGYSVFMPNYRGGTGYGRAFYEANRGRLGEIELMDIESGVDRLIATGKADPDRLFYGSWSWGGYLAAWTLGHSKRYRAIMVGAGVVDTMVQYVLSDINHGEVADWEFKGRPFTHPEVWEKSNPVHSLRGARSPTLIIHGQEDPRVGFVNAQILHRALTDLKIPVTMWAYPREPHGFREPAHVQHMLEVWGAFNDAHLPR